MTAESSVIFPCGCELIVVFNDVSPDGWARIVGNNVFTIQLKACPHCKEARAAATTFHKVASEETRI